jgi:hypothetical protein
MSERKGLVSTPRRLAQAMTKLLRSPALRRALVGVLLAVSPLVGCSENNRFTDTYNAPGTWHPTGVNELNIAAQVANPNDLVRGRGDNGGNLRTSVAAVNNLWSGKSDKAAAAGGGAGGGGGGAGVGAAGGAAQ